MDSSKNSKNNEQMIVHVRKETFMGLETEEILEKKSSKIFEIKTNTNSDKNNLNTRPINIPHDKNRDFSDLFSKSKSYYFKKLIESMERLSRTSLAKVKLDLLVKFLLHFIGNVINIIAVIVYMIETYFENLNNENSRKILLHLELVEISCCFYFIFEYLLSFTQVRRSGILRKILSLDSFIDILSILPTVIIFFRNIEGVNFLKILKVFRVFRILRLYKSLKLLKIENENNNSELDHFLKFNPVKVQFFTILMILICHFFIGAGLVLALQDLVDGAWNIKGINFFDAIYFMISTYTSVGYGDILPKHILSRFFLIVGIFCFIIIVSDQVSKMAALLSVWGTSMKRFYKKDHIIIIANANVNLEIFLKEIRERDLSVNILILSRELTRLPHHNYPFNKVTLITVLNYDLETLEKANTKHAKAVFIFCHKKTIDCDHEEKINDFLTLKLNRYFKDIPVYLQTLYSEGSFYNVIKNSDKKTKSSPTLNTIPIMRIKSLLISKASYINGFPTFMQNLMINNKELPDQTYKFSTLMSAYIKGFKNKIFLRKIPKFFNKKMFFDACHMMYFKSIHNYFVEINSLNTEYYPIIFMGMIDRSKMYIYKKENILIFPSRKDINIEYMEGIFMCNSEHELDIALDSFDTNDISIINNIRDSRVSNKIKYLRNLSSENIDNLNMIKNNNTDYDSNQNVAIENVENPFEYDNENLEVNPEIRKSEDEFGLHKKKSFTKSMISSLNRETLKLFDDNNILAEEIYSNDVEERTEEDQLNKFEMNKTDLIHIKKISTFIHNKNLNYRNKSSIDFVNEINSPVKDDIDGIINNQNIKLMEEAELTEEFDFVKEFDHFAIKRYGNFSSIDVDREIERDDREKFVENRIYILDKQSVFKFKHIIIIGVQDGIKKLLNLLSHHYPTTDICLFSNMNPEEKNIFKLLKLFKNLNYFKGNSGDPQHLLNAGIDRSLCCIFLTENINSRTDEDMGKILSYRSIEYFFNTNMILEVWNIKSLRFLAYQPLHKNVKLVDQDFLHPTYMAGRVILVSHLDKIVADKYYDPKVFDVWMSILTLGFSSSKTNTGYQTLIQKNEDFPVMLTIDIPSQYVGEEYHILINDLLLLENPAICLGLYILNPLDYLKRNSSGKVRKKSRKYTALKMTNSYKRKMMNKEILDKVQQTYKNNMNIIKEVSYNDQVILDNIDINKNHLPIFITNPSPGFVIGENCQALVFYFFNYNKTINTFRKYTTKKQINSSNFYVKSTSIITEQEKNKLDNSQHNFFTYLDDLKHKARKKYEESMKIIETERQNSFYESSGR